MNLKRLFKGPWLWIIVITVVVMAIVIGTSNADGYKSVKTATMVSYLEDGKVKEVTFVDGDQQIQATLDDGKKVKAKYLGDQGVRLVQQAEKSVADKQLKSFDVKVPKTNPLLSLLFTLLPIILIFLLIIYMMNNAAGGGGRVMQFAKSKAKLMTKDTPKTTFADVAGVNEAIEELGEIKEFLQEPAKFQAVGAKIPKGVLLYGPPGTGKTLLARAVAGEAGVPFYSISGSDFVEMFVGVGASRVRDLFEQAKENAPAIVFIDEIDAVGRHRGTGMGGGHDEREQTLNQLLVEMDGFDVRGGVILIAATNRPDVLDPALLRPGRFDRQIGVEAPDLAGRTQILKVHSRGKPIAPGVDLEAIGRRTPGFSGADLANVLNEAALLTARNGDKTIDQHVARRGDRPGHLRPAEAQPSDERERAAHHGLSRGRPRSRRRGAPAERSGAQDHDPAARSRAGLHDGAARRGQVLPDPSRAARQARLHDGRPSGRGARVPRPDDRRRQRHREGHQSGPRDGHAVRHDRAPRRRTPRRERGRSRSWAATSVTRATTPRPSRPSSTRRSTS